MIQGAAIQMPPKISATGSAVGFRAAVPRMPAPPSTGEAIMRRYSDLTSAPAERPASRAVVHSSRCLRLTAIRHSDRPTASSEATARCAAVASRRPSWVM